MGTGLRAEREQKMDLVDWSEEVYEGIAREYADFARKLGVDDLTFIPISALQGDNVGGEVRPKEVLRTEVYPASWNRRRTSCCCVGRLLRARRGWPSRVPPRCRGNKRPSPRFEIERIIVVELRW